MTCRHIYSLTESDIDTKAHTQRDRDSIVMMTWNDFYHHACMLFVFLLNMIMIHTLSKWNPYSRTACMQIWTKYLYTFWDKMKIKPIVHRTYVITLKPSAQQVSTRLFCLRQTKLLLLCWALFLLFPFHSILFSLSLSLSFGCSFSCLYFFFVEKFCLKVKQTWKYHKKMLHETLRSC